MRGLTAPDPTKVNAYHRKMQVSVASCVLTVTGADGSALAAVVLPTEEHKYTVAVLAAIWGANVADCWERVPKATAEDVPAFQRIYDQVCFPSLESSSPCAHVVSSCVGRMALQGLIMRMPSRRRYVSA